MKIEQTSLLLENVKIFARHGVDPQEQETGAYYYITLKADCNFQSALTSDDLHDTVSYADLYLIIKSEMSTPSKLLEHVAGRILERIFREHPTITRIRLEILKENPPMGAECAGAGVHITAIR
jgi:dihydroneopterin aldolase